MDGMYREGHPDGVEVQRLKRPAPVLPTLEAGLDPTPELTRRKTHAT